MSTSAKYPEFLPILPLQGVIVYPQTAVPLTVGQPRSIKLVDDVVGGDKLVGLVAAVDPELELPTPNDLYRVGTVAILHRLLRAPDGTLRLLVQGMDRFRLEEFVAEEPYLKARIKLAPEWIEEGLEIDALARNARDQFQLVVQMTPSFPKELAESITTVEDPLQTAYTIANFQRMDLEDAQEILEINSAAEKLKKLIGQLVREAELLELEQNVQNEARGDIKTVERESFPRDQKEGSQKEVGEKDELVKQEPADLKQLAGLNHDSYFKQGFLLRKRSAELLTVNPKEALSLAKEALHLFERIDPTRLSDKRLRIDRAIIASHTTIALVYNHLADQDKAAEHIILAEEINNDRYPDLAEDNKAVYSMLYGRDPSRELILVRLSEYDLLPEGMSGSDPVMAKVIWEAEQSFYDSLIESDPTPTASTSKPDRRHLDSWVNALSDLYEAERTILTWPREAIPYALRGLKGLEQIDPKILGGQAIKRERGIIASHLVLSHLYRNIKMLTQANFHIRMARELSMGRHVDIEADMIVAEERLAIAELMQE